MRNAIATRFALALVASIAVFAGCGGSAQPLAPVAASDGHRTAPASASGALLYVSDLSAHDVKVFSYPGGVLRQTLRGFRAPHGACVDGRGDVFITSTAASEIVEYAHGGTRPLATLQDPGWFPYGCSVDPVTGNLAVCNNTPQGPSTPANVAIYAHASGTPTLYPANSGLWFVYFCGYDDRGNLFVDGLESDGHTFRLEELRAGGKALRPISMHQTIILPGAVQWHGGRLAIGDQVSWSGALPSRVYDFAIRGNRAVRVHTTVLLGSCDVLQAWIQQNRVIAPNVCTPKVMYYGYPAGGKPAKVLIGVRQPVGVTVSEAQR